MAPMHHAASAAEISAPTFAPRPITTPHDAAEALLPTLITMRSGFILLLLDRERTPMTAMAIHNAPRNEFDAVVNLLAQLPGRPAAVVLGVLAAPTVDLMDSHDVDDVQLTDRLVADAATVHAWAEFSCALDDLGIALLDVIECTAWGWTSAHAPGAPYLEPPARSRRHPARRPRQAWASATR